MDKFLIFDGAMGTMLQKKGLVVGELPEMLNLTSPDVVTEIHKEYVLAGADVVTTNTFGANRRKFNGEISVDTIISSAVKNARASGAKYIALDIGPTGAMLKPIGEMSFDEAYEIFKEQVISGTAAGADIILIETMSDLLEAKAALLAAKENSTLPVFVTMTFSSDGRTFLGTEPKVAAITLCSLGADAVGLNCSLGPNELLPLVREVLEYSTVPVIVQPNAGLPKIENSNTVYKVTPSDYAESIEKMLEAGVSIIGGCCGTTPDHIREVRRLTENRVPSLRTVKKITSITSAQKCVILDKNTAVIGERINPTGKKKLKEALRNRDYDYIATEAINQTEAGADILDVNVGLPEINESQVLCEIVEMVSSVTSLPLQIDSSDPKAIEAAVRIYSGKPIINSVNGKEESLTEILPIVKKYGTAVVALTLDDNGIPETAEGRFEIAKKIVERAQAIGIDKENIIVDCLVLTASTNQKMVMETLRAIQLVKGRLGVKTVLGVSNVSFGLPSREIINSTFLAAAFGAGLDMPILNPMSSEYMKIVDTFKVLNNEDIGSEKFINKYSNIEYTQITKAPEKQKDTKDENETNSLENAILKGKKATCAELTSELLKTKAPMEIINEYFIPVLDKVGERFEKGELFLPQLMSSAEAVKAGFDVIKEKGEKGSASSRGKILLATVKGDIHDIGKNIVKMLLENYGYDIVDLGRDVAPEKICDMAEQMNIRLVGLSALMTTTVKNMEVTIKMLRERKVDCKVVVGGAVLTPEYAEMVGADYFAKDAMETAKIAAEFFSEN